MKCLVIGGSGFIGSFLIKKLISEKNEVVNFDLQDSNISEVNTIIGDINNREDLEDIKSDFDIVYIDLISNFVSICQHWLIFL